MTETQQLFELLEKGVSPAHVVSTCAKRLSVAGFQELAYEYNWDLCAGGRYYIKHNATTLFAFTIPEKWEYFIEPQKQGAPHIRIAAAHTDFPCLRIKPACDLKSNGYAQVNVEVYGGPILNTWLDRPLGVAGRVALRSESVFSPDVYEFVSSKKITIPNLAIHMNREVNKGVELNKQTELLPIVGLMGEESDNEYFLNFLCKELEAQGCGFDVKKEDILDYELTIFNSEAPEFVGLSDEFISASRLDNINSCSALVSAIIDSDRKSGMNMIALFDHEEIGSRSKQGAASILLHDMIYRILNQCKEMGIEDETALSLEGKIYTSMILSVDVAHGLHPNYVGKMDITNKPVLGKGFCIKEACSQAYATDCEAVAIVEQICKAKEIPYQKFVNRSDVVGGGTLGSIASALLPVKTVDVGIPLLAMHSARELMAESDQQALKDLVEAYFSL